MHASTVANAIHPLSQGFLLCISMIIMLGPQNMFILRQGLRRRHLFATALISTLADVVLIAIGVGGIGVIASAESSWLTAVTGGGAFFLLWCGGRSLLSAWRIGTVESNRAAPGSPIGLQATIIAALSFSLLNPAAYLDTLVIIGSKSVLIPIDQRLIFGLGAVLASAVWFFTLTYGASRLAPVFRHPAAVRTLDIVSGCIMVGVAGKMVAALYLPMI